MFTVPVIPRVYFGGKVLLVILGIIGVGAGPAVASFKKPIPPPPVSNNLKVPKGQVVLLKTLAKGVQIYTCKAKAGEPNLSEWTLKAPEAKLLNDGGGRIGKHYAGPTWEARDGSKVVGEVKMRAEARDANAIPWLLLTAKSHQGNGEFSQVTYIQRVNTVGGKAPAQGCNMSRIGAEARVDYTSDYYFYVPRGN